MIGAVRFDSVPHQGVFGHRHSAWYFTSVGQVFDPLRTPFDHRYSIYLTTGIRPTPNAAPSRVHRLPPGSLPSPVGSPSSLPPSRVSLRRRHPALPRPTAPRSLSCCLPISRPTALLAVSPPTALLAVSPPTALLAVLRLSLPSPPSRVTRLPPPARITVLRRPSPVLRLGVALPCMSPISRQTPPARLAVSRLTSPVSRVFRLPFARLAVSRLPFYVSRSPCRPTPLPPGHLPSPVSCLPSYVPRPAVFQSDVSRYSSPPTFLIAAPPFPRLGSPAPLASHFAGVLLLSSSLSCGPRAAVHDG